MIKTKIFFLVKTTFLLILLLVILAGLVFYTSPGKNSSVVFSQPCPSEGQIQVNNGFLSLANPNIVGR